MQSTLALREKMAQLLAADASTLAPAADGNLIKLIKAPFNPTEDLAYGDLTYADFDGSTPIECGTGTQPEGLDPNSAAAVIAILPPAGGFRFEVTGGTNLPQTIYGFALVNNGETTLLASEALDTPVVLTAVNQFVLLENVTLTQAPNSLT